MAPPERRRGEGRALAGRRRRQQRRVAEPSVGADGSHHAAHVCFLHIGTMKSGTTFIQQMLSHHRDALAEDGLLFPGRGGYVQQINAVRDVLDMPGTVPAVRLEGAWNELRREIAEWPGGTSIVSVEHLSVAPAKRVPSIVESLAPATVHVVLTARDLARVLPSTWQENVQNGLTWAWPDFLASIREHPSADPTAGQRFWRQHDLVRTIKRWAEVVGTERIHLVTLPPSGAPADELWRRFCAVVGLDASRYPADGAALRSNKGLDRAAAEMLRRVNVLLGDVDRAAKLRILKRGLAKSGLVEVEGQLPTVLDAEQYAWARHVSEALVAELAAIGVDVVGDLRELVPPDRPEVPVEHLREPTETEIADAAAAATAALLGQLTSTRPEPRRRRPAGGGTAPRMTG